MSYVVDYGALDSLDSSIFSQCSQWQGQLSDMESAVSALMGTANLSGNSANNIKNYLKSVHGTVISLLGELIYLHSCNFKVYKSDYQAGVDTDLHAVIHSEKLTEIQEDLRTYRNQAASVDDQLAYVLRDVRDIFSIPHRDIYSADKANRIAENYVRELDQQIQQLEAEHSGRDFEATEALITSLTTFLNEQLNRPAGMLTGFDIMQLAASGSFASLYEAHNLAYDQITSRQGAFEIAMENDAQRAEALLKEYEERQKKATAVKWIVTGVCVIGSIVAIAATGGAATPLVVGSVSAVSGAVMAGANNLADQYVQNGNLIENGVNWASLGQDVFVGGVTGFVTGYVGSSVSQAATGWLTNNTALGGFLGSQNAVVRIGSGAIIGSASEVSSGIVTRGAVTFLMTGDTSEAIDSALDKDQILFDAALGGATGGFQNRKAPNGAGNMDDIRLDPDDPDYIDWENTSNTNAERKQIAEMEANGDFGDYGTPDLDANAVEPEFGKKHLPTSKTGSFSGERGNSEFTPNNKDALDEMAKYGRDTVTYKGGDADFSPFSTQETPWGEIDTSTEIGHMTSSRANPSSEYGRRTSAYDTSSELGNFSQYDIELSRKINETYPGANVTPKDVGDWIDNSGLTRHEIPDGKTMQLVPKTIHDACRHSGGVAEMKVRMAFGDISQWFD